MTGSSAVWDQFPSPGRWTERAECAGDSAPESWTDPSGPGDLARAIAICGRCPVTTFCAAYGRETHAWGVWGGTLLINGHTRRTRAA
jgi:hypothetical protein